MHSADQEGRLQWRFWIISFTGKKFLSDILPCMKWSQEVYSTHLLWYTAENVSTFYHFTVGRSASGGFIHNSSKMGLSLWTAGVVMEKMKSSPNLLRGSVSRQCRRWKASPWLQWIGWPGRKRRHQHQWFGETKGLLWRYWIQVQRFGIQQRRMWLIRSRRCSRATIQRGQCAPSNHTLGLRTPSTPSMGGPSRFCSRWCCSSPQERHRRCSSGRIGHSSGVGRFFLAPCKSLVGRSMWSAWRWCCKTGKRQRRSRIWNPRFRRRCSWCRIGEECERRVCLGSCRRSSCRMPPDPHSLSLPQLGGHSIQLCSGRWNTSRWIHGLPQLRNTQNNKTLLSMVVARYPTLTCLLFLRGHLYWSGMWSGLI